VNHGTGPSLSNTTKKKKKEEEKREVKKNKNKTGIGKEEAASRIRKRAWKPTVGGRIALLL